MADEPTTSRTNTTVPGSSDANGQPSAAAASKTKKTPKTKPKAGKQKASGARPKVRRPFPQYTLEEALAVPQAIKDKSKGKPLDSELNHRARLRS